MMCTPSQVHKNECQVRQIARELPRVILLLYDSLGAFNEKIECIHAYSVLMVIKVMRKAKQTPV